MSQFATIQLPTEPTEIAPDGSEVRVLQRLASGSMAHFALGAGKVSHAIAHRTVDEFWYVLSGRGEMWRMQGDIEVIVTLIPGVCLTIPVGTHFQFRAAATQGVAAVSVSMPPWPGLGESVQVNGPWQSTEPVATVLPERNAREGGNA